MSYLSSGLAANDPTFQVRIAACLYKLATDVQYEDPATEDHEARERLSRAIVNAHSFPTKDFAWLCVTNASIAASITIDLNDNVVVGAPDGDIEFVCASNFTRIAKLRVGAMVGPAFI